MGVVRRNAEPAGGADGDPDTSPPPQSRPQQVDVALLDRMRDGIFVLDRGWTYVFCNEAGAQMVGRTVDELIGCNIWEAFPEAVGSMFDRSYRQALDRQETVEFEAHFDPLGRWYTVRAFPSPDGLTINFQDSSARHAADRALEALLDQSRRQQRLAAVLAETNEAVFRATSTEELFEAAVRIAVDQGGFVMSWIGVLDPLTGILRPVASAGTAARAYLEGIRITTADEPAGRGVGGTALRTGHEVCSNDIVTDPNMALWRTAAGRAGYRSSGAFPLLVDSQVEGLMSVYAAEPGYFDTEEIALVRRLTANVSYGWESLLREAALRESEVARRTTQRFRAVLSAAPDAIVGVSDAGTIELVNAEAERLFACRAEDLVGASIRQLLPGLSLADEDRRLAAEEGQRREAIETAARRLDGTELPAEVTLSRVSDDDHHPLVLASVRDLTERFELEAERRRRVLEAERERTDRLESLGKLAGGVAHDFNNLLGVILNYTTLLERQLTGDQALADLREVRAAAQRGAELTRQLLSFARRDAANPEPLEVGACVRAVASMLERTLGPSIELRLELEPGPLVVVLDRQQLDQLILNLAINARDAMANGGVLTISTERTTIRSGGGGLAEAEAVAVRVADTGLGMPPEVAARAFEPFFTTKPRGEGTGLGLAAVYGIARRGGGRAEIASSEGTGTTVTVVLPLFGGDASTTMATPQHAREEPVGGRERILVVEDDERLRDATARILAAAGYGVVVASDGLEALEVLEQRRDVALVLTDVVMPRMSGDELAAALQARSSSIKVSFMTGYDSGEVARTGRVLLKPLDERRLLEVLDEELHG